MIFSKKETLGIIIMFLCSSCSITRSILKTNNAHRGFKLSGAVLRSLSKLGATSILSNGRLSSEGCSLDTNLIASNMELVLSHLKARRADSRIEEDVLKLKTLRAERNSCIIEGDKAKNIRKTLSKDIGMLMKQNKLDEVAAVKLQVEQANIQSAASDEKLAQIDEEIKKLFSVLPNLLDDRVPDGSSDVDNPVVYSWGLENRKVGPNYFWHDEIAKGLGGLDMEAASKVSGARFSVLVGPLAKLERAIIQFFLDFHTSRGYTEVSVPYIVSRSTLEGTGQLPKFEEDLFKVSHSVGGEDAFLIPTAEVPVTNLFNGQILNVTDLPLRIVCASPSFRAEAGSYGRDTRGLLRQHQFHKVELVKVCSPDASPQEHEALTADAEEVLKALKLPYRKVLLCSGDTGFSARMCYDLEVWLPGQQEFREISSCSNCGDFQARRMSLRFRPAPIPAAKNKPSLEYPHTLNGSGLAVGRTLVAILENYQQEDGSIVIPEVLRPYMGGIEVLHAKTSNIYKSPDSEQ